LVDFGKAGDAVGGQLEDFDSVEEPGVGVAFPSGPDALVEGAPSLIVFFRI